MNSGKPNAHEISIAHWALLLTAIIWGFAFVVQRTAMEFIGPFYFGGLRFALGAGVLILFYGRKKFLALFKTEWRAGAVIGFFLTVGATLQQIGMVQTTAGKGGFITGLYIVFIPIILRVFWKTKVTVYAGLGVILATTGLYLLSINESISINPGDLWVLASAIAFAFHIIFIGRLGSDRDPLWISIFQYIVCALCNLLFAFFCEELILEGLIKAGWAILYGGLISIAIGYSLQIYAQRQVAPTPTALILSLESVVAVLFGWLLLAESLQPGQILGCILMLTGVVFAQMQPGKKPAATPATL